MNLKDFYYFLDLSQQQSFTGVAQKHGISQPSVSYAIKRLEKEFHCPLIAHDPSHRTFKLTPQGEILLRHIQKVLPEIQGAKKRSSGVSLNSIRLVSHQSSLTILSENNPPLSVMLQLFKVSILFKKGLSNFWNYFPKEN